ncbi:MAG: phosphoribosylamine--glycine ligase [Bdellovibrionales bacterium]
MNILVIGSGAREHALCWAMRKSPLCGKLYCAPGNAGIAEVAECLPVGVEDLGGMVKVCREHGVEFVVVGPELPLSLGMVDAIRAAGIPCFGPNQAAAEIESSKTFMKEVCAKAGVPTAAYRRFAEGEVAAAQAYVREQGAPIVVKADGLAAGKGVTVARTVEEAIAAIDDAMVKKVFGAAGCSLVIEEFMEGEEASFFAICDGKDSVPLVAAQDHKAVFDGDKGPNTGGMGAYSPTPAVDAAMEKRLMREVMEPIFKTMREMGRPFTGVLYAGLMMTKEGPKIVEFNARFGDPEAEVLFPRLKSDVVPLLLAASQGEGKLKGVEVAWRDDAALCVVMAAKGYPGAYEKGSAIRGLERVSQVPNAVVFHAATKRDALEQVVSNGGRVLGVTATGATIVEAQRQAYAAVDVIDWRESHCRRDIGWRAIKRQ